jgi:hypothetical protein
MTDNPVSEEMVMALADGELDADVAKKVQLELEHTPNLKRLYKDMLESRAVLNGEFGGLGSDDKYQEFVQFIGDTGKVIEVNFLKRHLPEFGRLAASLAVGTVIGSLAWNTISVSNHDANSSGLTGKIELLSDRNGETSQSPHQQVTAKLAPIRKNRELEDLLAEGMPSAHQSFEKAVVLLSKGGESNLSNALQIFSKASQDGHPLASFALAILVDLDQSEKYYLLGAEQISRYLPKK